MAEKGKYYIYLFIDAKFSLFILSNFLTCIGGCVPFIFTLVGISTKKCEVEFNTVSLQLTFIGSCIDNGS